jgi:hypothetical protein
MEHMIEEKVVESKKTTERSRSVSGERVKASRLSEIMSGNETRIDTGSGN